MIVLLSCSMNLYASSDSLDCNLSTGEVTDSVLIAYDDLRIANSKLIQLNYEQEINNNLRSIIKNDSIIINKYKELNNNLNTNYNKTIRQRNYAIGGGLFFLLVSILSFMK